MSKDPDDIFNPGQEIPSGTFIDVTPKKEETREGVDFDSDKPLIEQVLEKGDQGPDRTDRRPSVFDDADWVPWFKKLIFVGFLLGLIVAVLVFIIF